MVCKALGDTVVLAAASASSGNGSNLTTTTYTDGTDNRDEWQLFENVSFSGLVMDIDDTATPKITTSCPKNLNKVTDYTYTVTAGTDYVSVNSSTGVITALKSGTATVKATHKVMNANYTFSVKVNKNAIIIVPGIFGSELFAGEGTPYFKNGAGIISTEVINVVTGMADTCGNIWNEATWQEKAFVLVPLVANPVTVSTIALFADAFYTALECDEDGTSKYNVYTKKYKPELGNNDDPNVYTTNCGTLDAYGNLYRALSNSPEISEKYNIEFFSYDWRLSNGYSAQKLDEFIDEAGYDKVILVAHSMGGLVASGYLALGEEQRNKTIDVYMLASPLLGTPEVINVWANLDFSFLGFNTSFNWIPILNVFLSFATLKLDAMRELLSNYQSVYELLPTEKYLEISLCPYLIHEINYYPDIWGKSQTIICNDYVTSKSVLSYGLSWYKTNLMNAAELFHDGCYLNNKHITQYVDSYYVYAISEGTTLTQLKYSESWSVSFLPNQDIEGEFAYVENASEIVGDNLVPYWSATLGLPTNNIKVEMISGDHMDAIESTMSINYVINHILSN